MRVRPSMFSLVALLLAAACSEIKLPSEVTPDGSTALTVSAVSPTVIIGDSTHVIVKNAAGEEVPVSSVTLSSDAPTIATVSSNGTVSGKSAGAATITATNAGQTATVPIIVVSTTPVPVPPGGEVRIPLTVLRFDGGSGSVLVSNAIPLTPGLLAPTATKNVQVIIGGAQKSIYVEALEGRHSDGSLRSILVQFQHTIGSTETVSGELVIGAARTTPDMAKPTASRGIPLAAALPTDPNYLVSTDLVGPTLSKDSTALLGADYQRYDADFAQWADYHWTATADAWNDGYYYDRAMVYYAAWVRTGNPTYWYRGNRSAISYRSGYLESAGSPYEPPANWSFVEGLSMHYWVTGDDASRYAVGRLAEYSWRAVLSAAVRDQKLDTEGRIAGRAMQAVLFAHLLNAGDSGIPIVLGANNPVAPAWSDLLKATADYVLAMQASDGAIRPEAYCRQSASFSTGILDDVLIQYYTLVKPDARIPGWMKKSSDYLKTQWDPQKKAFLYISGACPAASSDPTQLAGDLNGLIINTVAWTYKMTRQQEYHDFADQIFAGLVMNAYPAGDKQFNQAYADSYRYLVYRR